ncbi:MAG: YwiC-like family protein, partial [Actinomycetota bacterium]|nr:YwiC-like family protein [Actinomycetota bacterium]
MKRSTSAVRLGGSRSIRTQKKNSYFPPQHGAWAFLALPLALGATVSTWSPLFVLLAITWIAAYPMSYAAFGLVRAKRPQRFRAPLFTWAGIALLPAALLVIWRPWLLWIGLAYGVLLMVNLYYARRNDERALANDGVFILECAGMVAVVWALSAGEQSLTPPRLDSVPAHVLILTIICALVLLSSTLHVKSLIRERRNPRYAFASR